MLFLTPDNVLNIRVAGVELAINQRIIPDDARAPRKIAAHVPKGGWMKPGAMLGDRGNPKGITIHNTCDIVVPPGTNPAEQYSRATWPNANMLGVVVHFYVWRRDIWQNLTLSEQGWHAGDGSTRRKSKRRGEWIGGNIDTIAIEVIGSHPESNQTAALLSAWLLREKDLSPATDLYTHNYFMDLPERIVPGVRKNCPLFILPDWAGFQKTVSGYYTALGKRKSQKAAQQKAEDDHAYYAANEFMLKYIRERHYQLRKELAELSAKWPPAK